MSANHNASQTESTPQETMVQVEGRELLVTRVFAAPQSLVFEAFSDCKHLKHWWAPEGWSLSVCKMDFRVGGSWHYCMAGSEGEEAWGKAVYTEIETPARILYMDYFTDAEGVVAETMPGLEIMVVFEEVGKGTLVTSTAKTGTDADMQALVDMGMVEGLKQTWDRLVEHLAGQTA